MKQVQKNVIITSKREQAQHQHAKQKKKKHKRKYILYYFYFLFFLLMTLLALSLTVFFHIESIQVEGNGQYQQEDIIKSSGIQVNDNLFRTNVKAAQKKILKEYIYLDSVVVKRALPASIVIRCTPATVAYNYKTDTGYIYVSQGGRILEVDQPEKASGAFTISGIDIQNPVQGNFITQQNQQELEKFKMLQTQMQETGLTDITGIELTENGANVTYQDRIVIEIDNWDNASYILQASKKILDLYIGAQETGKIIFEPGDQSIHFVPDVQR